MTKKEICDNNPMIGLYAIDVFHTIVIKAIDYSINDTVYFEFDDDGKKSYHKSKIYYDSSRCYFKFYAMRVFFDEVMLIEYK